MSTFETKVLTQLDDINGRLDRIQRRILGDEDDPLNRGIYGALTVVTKEVDAIKKRQHEFADDIDGVEEEQTRQKAWLKGAGVSAGLSAGGIGVVLAKVFNAI